MRLFALCLLGLSACTPVTMTTDPVEGGPCSDAEAGFCSSPTRLLACRNLEWVVASDCKGANGCRYLQTEDAYECDSTGNSIGDRCAVQSEGKVRCDPNSSRSILRCRDGGFTLEFDCPGSTQCVFVPDAGLLTCG